MFQDCEVMGHLFLYQMFAYMELIYYICGMGIEKIRKVIYTDEFMDYYWSLDAKLREKYSYIVNIIETQKVVNEKFVKKLVGTPYYEARVSFGSNEYRSVIFTIDKESFVECTRLLFVTGFLKKSTKDYKKEIGKADRIIKELED